MLRTVRLALANAPIRYTILGHMIGTGVGGATTFWAVSFFVRVHHLANHQAAMIIALCLGACGTVGAIAAGRIVDRVARGNPQKIAVFTGLLCMVAATGGICMALAPSLPLVIAAYAVTCFAKGGFVAPSNLLLLNLTSSRIRGAILSLNKLVAILIGGGLFSWAAGFVSDQVGGQDGIRIGMLTVFVFFFLGAALFLLIPRAMKTHSPQDDVSLNEAARRSP